MFLYFLGVRLHEALAFLYKQAFSGSLCPAGNGVQLGAGTIGFFRLCSPLFMLAKALARVLAPVLAKVLAKSTIYL